jgi:chromosome segregation ATPase
MPVDSIENNTRALRAEVAEKEELASRAQFELEEAQMRNQELQTRNTELEMILEKLNESILTMEEKLASYSNETLDLEAECEAKWEARMNTLTTECLALRSRKPSLQ